MIDAGALEQLRHIREPPRIHPLDARRGDATSDSAVMLAFGAAAQLV